MPEVKSGLDEKHGAVKNTMARSRDTQFLKILDVHRRYFATGHTLNPDFRKHQLLTLKQMIKAYEDRTIKALAADMHKSEYEAYATEIGLIYSSIDYTIKNLKKWTRPLRVKTPLIMFGNTSYIYPEPYGTVLIFGPFNYPVYLVMEPLIGAIAAGNCAVIKPSELTPEVSRVIATMFKEYFTEDYIRIIEGNHEVASTLSKAPFDYIFFTGSVRVGKMVMEAAARNLVPITLELGGKNPCIIDKTADIDQTSRKITWGKFTNAGQICVAPDYLIVHSQIKDYLIDSIKKYLKQFFGSNPKESGDFGRIVNTQHTQRLAGLIDNKKVVFGGDFDVENQYIAPTIMDRVEWNDPIMQEEIFGPILPVIEFTDMDVVIKNINTRPKPLALYMFTANPTVWKKLIDQVSFGGGCVNDVMIHLGNPNLPFGGVGASGIGAYHGKNSFTTFTHMKSVTKRQFNMKALTIYPPYTKRQLNMVKKFFK